MAITFTPGLAALSPEAKAAEYNTLINSGATDAQIKAAADATFGAQSAEDWSYLTNLASQIAPAATAPVTVEDLYQQYAGKTGDPEGLAFWKAGFGSDISPEEVASFRQSVAAVNAAPAASGALQQATQVAQPVTDFSGAAQDVVAATLTPQAIAWQQQQAANNALAEEQYAEQQRVAAESAAAWAAGRGVDDTSRFFQETFGSTPTQERAADLRRTYGSDLDEEERKQIILSQRDANVGYGGQSLDATSSGVVDRLTSQILNQGTTSQWGGEGYGSAQKTAADMALLLAAAGISDISQFGVRDKTVTTEDRYNEQGGIEQAGTTFTQPEYYNKATGQVINPYYDKASGNTWSGTFAGEGSTAYKVQFQPDGTPIFYSQYGGSSNDLAQVLDDPLIGAIVQTAAATFGGPLGTAALNLAMGKDIDDVAKAALTSYVAGQVASGVSGSTDVANTLGQTGANVAGKIAAATVMGGDPVQALITGGIGAAMPEITAQIPGYGDLSLEQKAFVNSAISSTLRDGNLSPQDLVNAAFAAGNAAKQDITTGGITNRVVDDTTTGVLDASGSAAFAAAKRAGATDEEALEAANTVTNAATGVTVGAVAGAGPSDTLTKTYTQLPAGEARIERERLAYEYADSLGKKIENLTDKEMDDFVNKVDTAISQNGSAVLKGASIQEILSGDYQKFRTNEFGERAPVIELTNLVDPLDAAGNVINKESTSTGSTAASNVADAIVSAVGGLEGTGSDIAKQGLSTLLGAVGEQIADLSTSLGNVGLISRDNAGVSAGKYLEDIGKRLELPKTTEAINNWTKSVSDATTYWDKLSTGVKGVLDNPLVLTAVGKEIIQEALPIGLAAKVAKYAGLAAGVATDTVLNALESAGSTGRQKYAEEIAKGTSPEEAAKIADKSAGYAGFITAATTGIVDSAIAKKYGDAIENYLGRKATTTGKEFGQESLEEGLISLATGDSLAEALTKSVVGGLVGAKTSGSIQTAADVQSDLSSAFAEQGLKSTDGSFKPDTIVPIDSGPSVETEVAKDATGIDATGDAVVDSQAAITVSDAQDTMSGLGLNVSDDTAVSLATKIQEATNSGNDVSVTSDANTVTINDATTNTNTTIDANTGVTTAVDNNNNVTTTVDGNTTTSVDANTNTTTQTTVDANTQTTTTVDANSNVKTQSVVDANTNTTTTTTVDGSTNTTTQTTIDANNNTQTTVVTDVNTGTQTTIKVNTDTGEILDEVETDIPDGWTTPVIAEPVVPSVVTPTPTTTTPTTTPAKATLPSAAGAGMLAGAAAGTLPFDWSPGSGSLRSKVTGEAIDPLARVKEAQAELERDAMMQNVDPRLMQILQQRMNPQQQSQQFEGDIGALSKLLGGGQESPSKDNYYSYGSEDSIDDILGGKAANYKEGGFVEPLKAEGGMVLPLLAKSGGALGHYKGREDFKDGKHVAGEGDGQSDDIPAWLADGEFVFSADVVAALGNGSTKAGTDKLYEMMHNIRERARSKGPKDLPPPALKSPLDYLKSSKRSTK